jgi:hypothetical protein
VIKPIAIGCLGTILGLIVGIVLTFAAMSMAPKQNLPVEPVPTLSSARSDVSITASATFINSQIQPAVRASGLLKQVAVTFEAPNVVRIATTVDTTILGQRVTANATATMRVAVKNNRITLTVEKIDTGNVAIPTTLVSGTVETLRAQAEDQINRLVQRALQGTSLRVINARVTPNDLTLDLASQ